MTLEWVHPGLLLILGAWLLPFLKGRAKRAGDARTACRGPDRLPAHEAWDLRRGELPGARSRVRPCGPLEPGLFLCVLADGASWA